MLSAYPTRSVRHSKGSIGKWMLCLPLCAVAAGIVFSAGNPTTVRSMTGFLPDVAAISETALGRRPAPVHRAASFRIGGPAAAGIAVLVNDSPELRARAEQARIRHASERLADDAEINP